MIFFYDEKWKVNEHEKYKSDLNFAISRLHSPQKIYTEPVLVFFEFQSHNKSPTMLL